MTRIRMIDRIARAVDRSTARERNEKQDRDNIEDNQTLLCLSTVQKTGQAAPRDFLRVRDDDSNGHLSWAARLGAAAGSTRTRPSSSLGTRR